MGRGRERWRQYGGSGLVSWATQRSGPPPGLLDFYKVEQYLVQYLLLVLGKTSNRAKFYITTRHASLRFGGVRMSRRYVVEQSIFSLVKE